MFILKLQTESGRGSSPKVKVKMKVKVIIAHPGWGRVNIGDSLRDSMFQIYITW